MTRVLTISCLHVFGAHMLAVYVHILTLANVEEVQVVTGHYSAAVSSELHLHTNVGIWMTRFLTISAYMCSAPTCWPCRCID